MAGTTVIVGCKIPNGLYLRNYKMVEGQENTPMGPRPIKRAQQIGRAIHIKGSATPYGHVREDPVRFGFAMTYGVSREFIKKWFEDNWDQDMVANNLIIYGDTEEDVIRQARSLYRGGTRSGLEPLDPQNLPQEFRGQRMKIVTADEQKVRPEDRPPPREPRDVDEGPRRSPNGRARRTRTQAYED